MTNYRFDVKHEGRDIWVTVDGYRYPFPRSAEEDVKWFIEHYAEFPEKFRALFYRESEVTG